MEISLCLKSKKNKIELKKHKVEQVNYIKQSELEIQKTKRALNDAENTLNLSKQALEQVKEAFRIRQNRMQQGLEKTSDLLISETLVAQKELEYIQAILQWNVTQKYLEFLTQ